MDYKEMFNELHTELSNKALSLDNAYAIELLTKFNERIYNSLNGLYDYWWKAQLQDMNIVSTLSLSKTERDAANVVIKAMKDIYDNYSKEDNK